MKLNKILKLPIIDISDCFTKKDVAVKLNLSLNGRTYTIVDEYIKHHGLSTAHFDPAKKSRKYTKIVKQCPVCGTDFEAKLGEPKEKTTCSPSCANTYFRSGLNNPNFKMGCNHRTMCFIYHKKECIICKESLIVEVHHYDENHLNNSPENLVPMCPTHHQYVHSNYKYLVIDAVDEYVKAYIKTSR